MKILSRILKRICSKHLINLMNSDEMAQMLSKHIIHENQIEQSHPIGDAYLILGCAPQELKISELVRHAYYDGITESRLPFINYADGKLIYYKTTDGKAFENNIFKYLELIVELHYAEVPSLKEKFKKFVYYDDFHNIMEFTDSDTEKITMSSTTCLIPIIKEQKPISDILLKFISDANKCQ